MTRAYYPWPSAYTFVDLKSKKLNLLKIIEADVSQEDKPKTGTVFLTGENELAIKCGKKSLIIKKLQLEGGKVLLAKEFLNGHRDFIGSVLK